MGLTESKIKDLTDKGFDKLYKKHEKAWVTMVVTAYDFAKQHISGGEKPHADDVLKVLLPTLEVNEDLRKHQEDNKCRYKRYREFFGDYIIDKYMSEQPKENKK